MFEYRFSVSIDGTFAFRSDWDDNGKRVAAAVEEIKAAFANKQDFSLSIDRRSKLIRTSTAIKFD